MTTPGMLSEPGDRRGPRRSRMVMVSLGGLTAIALVYLAVAMPGMDHSSSTTPTAAMSGMDHADGTMGWTRQGIDEFADTVAADGAVVINVHVPDEGSIAGTDLTIPYTDVLGARQLPPDRDTPLALYCRSGRMSTIAAQSLVEAGYQNVVELDGGMEAWMQAGRQLDLATPIVEERR